MLIYLLFPINMKIAPTIRKVSVELIPVFPEAFILKGTARTHAMHYA